MTPTLHSGAFLRTATPLGAAADIWFVHGFGESGLSFREAFASPLATTYNLYVPDLPGSGVTPKLPEVCSVSSMASFLASLLTASRRKVIARFKKDDGFRRYYASLRFADVETLWHLGKSGVAATGDSRGAEDFLAVPARKAYSWGGESSLSERSRKLLSSWAIPKRELPGAGHWPMVTQPERFYEALVEDVAAALAA